MVKFIQCVKCKPGMPILEFRKHWKEYLEILKQFCIALDGFQATASTTLKIEQNQKVKLSRGTDEPFDAVAELWIDNMPECMKRMEKPEVAAIIRNLRQQQEKLADMGSSAFFFAMEEAVYNRK